MHKCEWLIQFIYVGFRDDNAFYLILLQTKIIKNTLVVKKNAETHCFWRAEEKNKYIGKVCKVRLGKVRTHFLFRTFKCWDVLISQCLTNKAVVPTLLEESNSKLNNLAQFLWAIYACYHMPLELIAKMVQSLITSTSSWNTEAMRKSCDTKRNCSALLILFSGQ